VTAYPTSAILLYRQLAEQALEDICGVAFVPRLRKDEASIIGYGILEVPRRWITKVLDISTATNTGPQSLPSLTGLRINQGSTLFLPTWWNWWSMPITVTYESGYKETPMRISRAALELARRWLIESPWDERMTGFRSREGGSMQILTASNSDPFDIPEVVAVAGAYGTPMMA